MEPKKEKYSMLFVGSDQHKLLKIIAAKNGESIRDLTRRIFEEFLKGKENE